MIYEYFRSPWIRDKNTRVLEQLHSEHSLSTNSPCLSFPVSGKAETHYSSSSQMFLLSLIVANKLSHSTMASLSKDTVWTGVFFLFIFCCPWTFFLKFYYIMWSCQFESLWHIGMYLPNLPLPFPSIFHHTCWQIFHFFGSSLQKYKINHFCLCPAIKSAPIWSNIRQRRPLS